MGLFGFGRKKASDVIDKYLKDTGITYEYKDGKYSYSLALPDGLSLYPYFSYNEEDNMFSYAINIRKTDGGITLLDYERFNLFNLKSQYLSVKISESQTLYLEYNAITSLDNLKEILAAISESVFMLRKDIDEL